MSAPVLEKNTTLMNFVLSIRGLARKEQLIEIIATKKVSNTFNEAVAAGIIRAIDIALRQLTQ